MLGRPPTLTAWMAYRRGCGTSWRETRGLSTWKVIRGLVKGDSNLAARYPPNDRTILRKYLLSGGPAEGIEVLMDGGADVAAVTEDGVMGFELAQQNHAVRGTSAFLHLNEARSLCAIVAHAGPKGAKSWSSAGIPGALGAILLLDGSIGALKEVGRLLWHCRQVSPNRSRVAILHT